MRIKNTLSSYLKIILGALIAAFSVACVLLPNDAIDYGTAGIAIIISKLTGAKLSVCIIAVFIPFLILGFIVLGKRFFLRAFVGSAAYTIGIEIFEKIPFELNTEHFLAVAFGGALLGAGLTIILRSGGCIDGSEILANVIVSRAERKKNRNYSMTGILLIFNLLVYIAIFALIDRNSALLSLLVYVVATAVIDHFTDKYEAIKQVTIITQKEEDVVKAIKEEMNKTCTIMDSYGAVAGKNKTLICYVTYFEIYDLKKIIQGADIKAFITVSTIDEIIRKE